MNERDRNITESRPFVNKLWWLIVGRAAASVLLIGLNVLLVSRWTNAPSSFAIESTVLIGILALCLSLLYALLLRFSSIAARIQAGVQFLFDLLFATWLVWATGDITSPYTALYIVIIYLVSVLLGSREALLTSVGCAFCYTTVMLLITGGLIPRYNRDLVSVPITQAILTIGLNDIGFFSVGLLAARLAERLSRSDVKLIEATHALADLRALHKNIVESIRSGLATTDLEGRIYSFNPAAEEITGYKASDVRGKNISFLLGDIGERIQAAIRPGHEGHTNPRYEAECLTSEGLRLRLGYSISPLLAEGGRTTGLIITFQDLTEVRALEESSRRQEKLAAVGRVSAGIAHEIRNPLAAMRGSIQVLRASVPDDSAEAELMAIVLRESDRLNRIITDFLTYARPRPVSLEETDVREPLQETFMLLRNSQELHENHALEVNTPDEPIYAMIDTAGIKQVFWNLARNALQAMPDGGLLRAELTRLNDRRIRITFTDTGRGMTHEQAQLLFEPFSSSTGGTGLGLSITYQIIRDHGGTINVRSREERGTAINIELPGIDRGQRSEVRG